MTENKNIQTGTSDGSKKMLTAMVGIGVFCALLIVLTYEGTKERIETLKTDELDKAVFNVLPGITKTRIYEMTSEGTFIPSDGKDQSKTVVYAGFDESDTFKGVAIEGSGQGYGGVIRILYGYDPFSQAVVGFYVLESKETPGLGDKIEKDENFMTNFKALSVKLNPDLTQVENEVIPVMQGGKTQPWEVEGITGATISSRTIGNILGESTAVMVPLIYNQRDSFNVNPKQ